MKTRLYALLITVVFSAALYGQNTDSLETKLDNRMDYLFGEHKIHKEFFFEMKKAVLNSDSLKVADLIKYPITIKINGKKTKIKNNREFLKHYSRIIDAHIIETVRNQKYAELFANYQGVMIGNGEIWFSGVCLDPKCKNTVVKIIAVNK